MCWQSVITAADKKGDAIVPQSDATALAIMGENMRKTENMSGVHLGVRCLECYVIIETQRYVRVIMWLSPGPPSSASQLSLTDTPWYPGATSDLSKLCLRVYAALLFSRADWPC